VALSQAGQGSGGEQHSVVRQALTLCPILLFIACQQSLPTAPSELASGIALYEHADYLGESAHLTHNIADLKNVEGPCLDYGGSTSPPGATDFTESWDDCISSVRVAPGWRAVLYGDKEFKGLQLEVTGDLPNFQRVPDGRDLNDGMSSIRVFPP
jgi:hypothetical protein